ncbi:hypothetical protein NKR19_g5069 [Coniochaeta hoffmannii]|uniref:Uncharacterized protein n=1 Tax=Coniochaeta hoffmannii TaxID=91930 RepID=A0AA38VWX6_9PEZI|nr:hypothetical protein NKR19_g5069 [Coniochaeta hoffmannii]
MDRTKGPSLVSSPAQEAVKPASAPKLRRRLQKVKRPGSSAPNEASNNNSANNNKSDTPPKISLPLPPDLSDSKWSEYLRSSGYLCANLDTLPQPNNSLKPPVAIVPELSYLGPNHDTTPRSSVDTLESGSTDASATSVRRRAKTPVFHIGQLEARARARKLEEANRRAAQMREAVEDACRKQANSETAPAVIFESPVMKDSGANPARVRETNIKEATADNVTVRETNVREVILNGKSTPQSVRKESPARETRIREVSNGSVNLIAEQYKALIEPNDSRFAESRPQTPRSHQQGREGLTIRHKRSSRDLRRESQVFEHASGESPQGSPTSDGTLVAFEEETIYFKPLSFSPEPSSPLNTYETPMTSPLPTPNNIGLNICVDLLAKDLVSAVVKNDPSALQIWTMIEAYERLRDRIRESGLRYDEVMSLEQSFDTWLKALYAVHDRLAGVDRASESGYDDHDDDDELERAAEGLRLD